LKGGQHIKMTHSHFPPQICEKDFTGWKIFFKEKIPPGEMMLATEQLNTNEGGRGVNGKKLFIGESFEAKKKLFVHQT